MESFIKVKKEELNTNLLEKIKLLIEGIKQPEIIIQIRDVSEKNYTDMLQYSIQQVETGNAVSFTLEELEKYLKNVK